MSATTSRCSACTSRPISTRCCTRSPGLNDEERGWGRAGETWRTLESARQWGGEGWFLLGDLDLGLHLVRTQALRGGEPLSAVTAPARGSGRARDAAAPGDGRPGPHARVTPAGTFSFQEWFVGRRHEDEVDACRTTAPERARRRPGVVEAIRGADALVLAPSNPYVSIGPILAVAAIREAVAGRSARCVAVSPLVGGRAVKGPLDRMLTRMAGGTTPAHVAGCYRGARRRARDRRRRRAGRRRRPARRHATRSMTDRDAAARLAQAVLEAAA